MPEKETEIGFWGWGWGWGWAGCPEAETGLLENVKGCVPTEKNVLPDGQQQQAISIHVFLEGLGFRGSGFRGLGIRV